METVEGNQKKSRFTNILNSYQEVLDRSKSNLNGQNTNENISPMQFLANKLSQTPSTSTFQSPSKQISGCGSRRQNRKKLSQSKRRNYQNYYKHSCGAQEFPENEGTDNEVKEIEVIDVDGKNENENKQLIQQNTKSTQIMNQRDFFALNMETAPLSDLNQTSFSFINPMEQQPQNSNQQQFQPQKEYNYNAEQQQSNKQQEQQYGQQQTQIINNFDNKPYYQKQQIDFNDLNNFIIVGQLSLSLFIFEEIFTKEKFIVKKQIILESNKIQKQWLVKYMKMLVKIQTFGQYFLLFYINFDIAPLVPQILFYHGHNFYTQTVNGQEYTNYHFFFEYCDGNFDNYLSEKSKTTIFDKHVSHQEILDFIKQILTLLLFMQLNKFSLKELTISKILYKTNHFDSNKIILKFYDFVNLQEDCETEQNISNSYQIMNDQFLNLLFQAPELTYNYCKINQYNHYKCTVYSLGLIVFYIALDQTLPVKLRRSESKINPETTKSGPNDHVIQAQLEAIYQMYQDDKLQAVLQLMLKYNINERPDFIELYKICKDLEFINLDYEMKFWESQSNISQFQFLLFIEMKNEFEEILKEISLFFLQYKINLFLLAENQKEQYQQQMKDIVIKNMQLESLKISSDRENNSLKEQIEDLKKFCYCTTFQLQNSKYKSEELKNNLNEYIKQFASDFCLDIKENQENLSNYQIFIKFQDQTIKNCIEKKLQTKELQSQLQN